MDPVQLKELGMNPVGVGLLVGSVHHIKFQYPYQAGIFETLYGYGLLIIAYTVYHIIAFPTNLLSFLKDLTIFNATYVSLQLLRTG
jgi:hypothetical protein